MQPNFPPALLIKKIFLVFLFAAGLLISHATHAILVTTNADAGAGSLRAAIALANLTPGSSITFAPALAGQQVILGSHLPPIVTNMDIDASAAPNFSVNGNNLFAAFTVASSGGASVSISGINVINSRSQGGAGGVGQSVAFGGGGGGGAMGGGGAVFVAPGTTVFVTNINASGNSAVGGAGGIVAGAGTNSSGGR